MPASPPPLAAGAGATPGRIRTRAGALAGQLDPSVLVIAALLLAMLYAAFASGASGLPEETRLQVWLAIVATGATATWLWSGRLRLLAQPLALVGVVSVAAFAAWSGLSLGWSVAPDRTWLELNRAIAYALVLGLALIAGSSNPRARDLIAGGYLIVACLVGIYALGGKLAPGLQVGGLIDLNHTQTFSRLSKPLEYWNALALVLVMAAPVALQVALDSARRRGLRIAGLVALYGLIIVIGLTYSRGGVLALLVAIAVSLALGGERLRGLATFGLALLVAVPALLVGYLSDDLTGNGIPVGARDEDGALLAIVALIGGCALGLLGNALMVLGDGMRIAPPLIRRMRRVAAAAGAAAALVGFGALVVSEQGPVGTISDTASSFTDVKEDRQTDPARLLSSNSGNRWVWWEEAAGAWSDKPLRGWGAGSFPVTHKLYRENTLNVQQPHSVPLQFLAETGLVGFVLGLGGIGLVLFVAIGQVRAMARGPGRGMAAAMVGAVVAWLVHGLYDWDWDIPGASLPALAFLGVLAARGPETPEERSGSLRVREPIRVLAIAVTTLLACAIAASSVMPAIARSKSNAALSGLDTNATNSDLDDAVAEAEVAARLNPLAIEPLFVQATIAQRRGRTLTARALLLKAAERQPDDVKVWFDLARLEFDRRDYDGVRRAATRALAIDPRNSVVLELALRAQANVSPPSASPTATGTPLPTPAAKPEPVALVPGALGQVPAVPATP